MIFNRNKFKFWLEHGSTTKTIQYSTIFRFVKFDPQQERLLSINLINEEKKFMYLIQKPILKTLNILYELQLNI